MCELKRMFKAEDGAVLALVAICLVVLIGMAALAIDLGQLYVGRQRAQNVCDAAALAGARFLTGSSDCTAPGGPAATAAVSCADANNGAISSWQLNGLEVTFPLEVFYDYDPDTPVAVELGEAIRAKGYVTVNFGFARIFGFDSKDVYASATAVMTGFCSDLYVPLAASDKTIFGDETHPPMQFGELYTLHWMDWQSSTMGPGNYGSLRLVDEDSGANDYRMRLEGSYQTPI